MAHVYKATEWQSGLSTWYVADVQELGTSSGYWWIPLKILGLNPVDFVKLLKNDFNIKHASYSKEYNMLTFSFGSLEDARRYKNYINRKAREKNFICGL